MTEPDPRRLHHAAALQPGEPGIRRNVAIARGGLRSLANATGVHKFLPADTIVELTVASTMLVSHLMRQAAAIAETRGRRDQVWPGHAAAAADDVLRSLGMGAEAVDELRGLVVGWMNSVIDPGARR